MPSAEKASMRVTDLNHILPTTINQDIPYQVVLIPNTQNKHTKDTKEEHKLPPEYDTTWLNQKYFNDKMRSLMLRSAIARILDVTDVDIFIMKKDSSALLPNAETVPTDTYQIGILIMAMGWLGVFQKGAVAIDKFLQLKNMFPNLEIFRKHKDIKQIVNGWAKEKSEKFKKINRLNYKATIQKLADEGKFVSECSLLATIMTYLEPTIVNIINGK